MHCKVDGALLSAAGAEKSPLVGEPDFKVGRWNTPGRLRGLPAAAPPAAKAGRGEPNSGKAET